MVTRPENRSGFATTLAKGLSVLEAFRADRPLMRNSEIAAEIGVPRPTVARLTSTLAKLGYLKCESAKYRLSWRVMTLGHLLLTGLKILKVARPAMEVLAHDLGGAVSIAVLDGLNFIYVETARAKDSIWTGPDAGKVGPLAPTAIGQALCSLLPTTEHDHVVDRLRNETPDLWREYGRFFTSGVSQCREHGCCYMRSEWWPDTHTAAAPLFRDTYGDCFAVNCRVPAFRLKPGQLMGEIGPRLKSLAGSIRANRDEVAAI